MGNKTCFCSSSTYYNFHGLIDVCLNDDIIKKIPPSASALHVCLNVGWITSMLGIIIGISIGIMGGEKTFQIDLQHHGGNELAEATRNKRKESESEIHSSSLITFDERLGKKGNQNFLVIGTNSRLNGLF